MPPLEVRDADELPYERFVAEYMRPNRPVVVRNSVRDWPALKKWTPQYFKERFAERMVQVSYQDRMSFADFIDGVLASSDDKPGPYMYRLFLHEHLPEVLEDLTPQSVYAYPRRYASPLMLTDWRRPDGYLKLLIGGIGGRFPVMHFDGENTHATITEIYGEKEFLVYPPGDGRYLYPNPEIPNKSLIVDPHRVDPERFPLQAKATQHRAVLVPGDMVFVPSGWWHTARALTPSISIGMNIMDSSNWSGFVDKVCPVDSRSRPRQLVKRAYWQTVGAVMTACERLQQHLPGLAHKLRVPEHLAPLSSAVAPEPAHLQIEVRPRED